MRSLSCLRENVCLTLLSLNYTDSKIYSFHEKENLSIFDYLQKIKSFSDNLATIGQPSQAHEFTAYLFGKLDTLYDAIVTTISTQIAKMSSKDMFNHLLTFKFRFEQQKIPLKFSMPQLAR